MYGQRRKNIVDPVLYSEAAVGQFCLLLLRVPVRTSYSSRLYRSGARPGLFLRTSETRYIVDRDILGFPDYPHKIEAARHKTGAASSFITGNGTIEGEPVVFCATNFNFSAVPSACQPVKNLAGGENSHCRQKPLIIQATGGGARMHEGCSSMVSIPKLHVAVSSVEKPASRLSPSSPTRLSAV